ncbi:MAG TPA: nuclear transport factor 2 family protein [Steroidobacteraceae bacterium]|nr:nuclear transport factor 2 family protein [Steroidobacteraceae bacterium]
MRIALVLLMAVASPLAHAQKAGPEQTRQQFDEVAAADHALFSAFFDRCDTAALAKMVTDDFEMFHDKNGYMTKSGKEFLDGIEKTCARQKTGEDYRARRELVPGSLKVYPLNNYGAVEIGVHRFYQLLPGKPEKLVEVSQFTHVWKMEEGAWKLARVLSYDHRLAE